jgi:hypothetical protein
MSLSSQDGILANTFFENVARLKSLEMALMMKLGQDEFWKRLPPFSLGSFASGGQFKSSDLM